MIVSASQLCKTVNVKSDVHVCVPHVEEVGKLMTNIVVFVNWLPCAHSF